MLYPYVAQLLFLGDQVMAGLLPGTSIHETAQVTGGGPIYGSKFSPARPTAVDVAICVKLVRNAMTALIIPLMIVMHRRRGATKEMPEGNPSGVARLFPTFTMGFILLAVVRSVGDAGVESSGVAWAVWQAE